MTEPIKTHFKQNFPIFEREPDLIFLDNASTTQKPRRVLQAMENFYLQANANIHRGVYELAEKADQIYESGRQIVAKFIGAETSEVIFTKNATEAANMAAFSVGEAFVGAGDNLVVTELEHHANYLPWQEMAKRHGAEFRVIRVKNENGELDENDLENLIDQKTRVVAVSGMSNVLGVRPNLKLFREKAAEVGALLAIDCAQLAVHQRIAVNEMGCDLAFFTGHKLYGPMGIGFCFIKKSLAEKLPPFLTGGGMVKDLPDQWLDAPAKFEAGTPNVAAVAGLVEAIKVIESLGWKTINEREKQLVIAGREILAKFPQVKLFGSGEEVSLSSMIAFNVEGVHPHDLASVLAEDKICIRAGHHCAKPLLRSLGVSASARVSFAIYNEMDELERLAKSVERAINLFK